MPHLKSVPRQPLSTCAHPQVLGRLSVIASATGAIGAALGTIAAGLLVDHVSIIPLFNAQAIGYLLCGIATYFLIVRRMRSSVPQRP